MSWIDRAKAAKPQSIGEWILLAIAVCLYPFVEFKNFLKEKTYRGWEGGLRAAFGHLFGLAGGIYVGWLTGWFFEWPYLSWIAAGIATWPLTKWYFWPIGYWLVIHPVWWTCEKLWDGIRYVAKNWLFNILNGILNVLRCLPGSNALWTAVLDDAKPADPEQPRYREESWVQKLLYVITFPTAAFCCWQLGYNTYEFIFGAFSLPLLNWVAGVGAGLFVGLLSAGILWNWFEHGKVPALAVTAGGVALYFGAGLVATAAGAVGIAGWGIYAAYAVAFSVFVAYLYPAADWFLRNGIEWCWKKLKPAIQETYGEEDKDYAGFFHHLTNIVASGFVFWLTLGLCGDLGLGTILSYGLATVATLLGYELIFKALDEEFGNGLTGLALSGLAGYFVGNWWFGSHEGWLAADYATIGVGVVGALATGFVVFPIAYVLLRGALRFVGLHIPARDFLAWVYGGVDKAFRWVGKKLELVYTWSYRDKHKYAEFFLHAVNLVGTYFAATYLYAWTSGWWAILAWPAVAIGTGLVYLLLGKTLTKSGWGIEAVGGLTSIAATIFVGAHVHAVYPEQWYITGIVGAATLVTTFAIGFPAAYWIVKAPGWVLSLILQRPVVGLHNLAWARFEFIAEKFAAIYQGLVEALAPYFVRLAGMIAKIREMWARIRKTLTGK